MLSPAYEQGGHVPTLNFEKKNKNSILLGTINSQVTTPSSCFSSSFMAQTKWLLQFFFSFFCLSFTFLVCPPLLNFSSFCVLFFSFSRPVCLINSYLIFSIKLFNLLTFLFALLNCLFTFYISCFVYSSLIPIPNWSLAV